MISRRPLRSDGIFLQAGSSHMPNDDEFEALEAEQTAVSLRTLEPAALYGPLPGGICGVLEVTRGIDAGTRFEVASVPCLIGRGRHAQLRLRDLKLSRLHAAVAYENDEFRIVDNGSGNGTILNGSQVTSYRLQDGDTLVM